MSVTQKKRRLISTDRLTELQQHYSQTNGRNWDFSPATKAQRDICLSFLLDSLPLCYALLWRSASRAVNVCECVVSFHLPMQRQQYHSPTLAHGHTATLFGEQTCPAHIRTHFLLARCAKHCLPPYHKQLSLPLDGFPCL